MASHAEIFTELRPVLMKLAGRMLRSEGEAEDMVQERFVVMPMCKIDRLEKFAAGADFQSGKLSSLESLVTPASELLLVQKALR